MTPAPLPAHLQRQRDDDAERRAAVQAMTRANDEILSAKCPYCRQHIGWGRWFEMDAQGRNAHSGCIPDDKRRIIAPEPEPWT